MAGEVRLWRAFLDQMVLDTFWPNKETEDCADSKLWLYDRTSRYYPDFYKVCELADIDPRWVTMVIDKLEEGKEPL